MSEEKRLMRLTPASAKRLVSKLNKLGGIIERNKRKDLIYGDGDPYRLEDFGTNVPFFLKLVSSGGFDEPSEGQLVYIVLDSSHRNYDFIIDLGCAALYIEFLDENGNIIDTREIRFKQMHFENSLRIGSSGIVTTVESDQFFAVVTTIPPGCIKLRKHFCSLEYEGAV